MDKKRITLSEKRKQKLYNDVTEVVMKERLANLKGKGVYDKEDIDDLLFRIQQAIGNEALKSIESHL